MIEKACFGEPLLQHLKSVARMKSQWTEFVSLALRMRSQTMVAQCLLTFVEFRKRVPLRVEAELSPVAFRKRALPAEVVLLLVAFRKTVLLAEVALLLVAFRMIGLPSVEVAEQLRLELHRMRNLKFVKAAGLFLSLLVPLGNRS